MLRRRKTEMGRLDVGTSIVMSCQKTRKTNPVEVEDDRGLSKASVMAETSIGA